MNALRFEITFYSPFRVGAAFGLDGADLTVDADEPIPGDHLKGLMRSAGERLLTLETSTIGEVFGSTSTASPWSWSAAEPTLDVAANHQWQRPHLRNRVAIDDVTHAAREDHLVFGHEMDVSAATFSIEQHLAIDADSAKVHQAVLRLCARAVHSLGGWRRRGLGWVSIEPVGSFGIEADLETATGEAAT